MIIVGYGTETSFNKSDIDYWLVQNSWGDAWGEKGFVKVKRGENLCKIANFASYPVLKTTTTQPSTLIYESDTCEYS